MNETEFNHQGKRHGGGCMTMLILLICLLAVAICDAQTDVFKFDSKGTIICDTCSLHTTSGVSGFRTFKSEQPKSDTTQCYIVYIDTFPYDHSLINNLTLWMYGYKVEKAVFHPHDSFLYPPPLSDWYMEFDKYLDNDKKPLKSSVIVLMSKQIK